MRLNVNKLLHTPGSRQEVRFEMELSDLEFGGAYPVTRPVVVDGQLRNQAGMLLCELQITTTLHCICDRCAQEFDRENPRTTPACWPRSVSPMRTTTSCCWTMMRWM